MHQTMPKLSLELMHKDTTVDDATRLSLVVMSHSDES